VQIFGAGRDRNSQWYEFFAGESQDTMTQPPVYMLVTNLVMQSVQNVALVGLSLHGLPSDEGGWSVAGLVMACLRIVLGFLALAIGLRAPPTAPTLQQGLIYLGSFALAIGIASTIVTAALLVRDWRREHGPSRWGVALVVAVLTSFAVNLAHFTIHGASQPRVGSVNQADPASARASVSGWTATK
jgi:hypothetical protein